MNYFAKSFLFRGSSDLIACLRNFSSKVNILNAQPQSKDRLLKITFEDGQQAKFSFAWLRDNAPEPSTMELTEKCRSRKLLLAELDPNISPLSNSIDENGDLLLKWPDLSDSVKYTSDWLRKRNLDSVQLRTNRNQYYIPCWDHFGAKEIESELGNPADWNLLFDEKEEKYLMEQLERLLRVGILRCVNVPQEERQVHKFGELMGFMQYSHYGDSFHVHAKSAASNLSYTNKTVGLHTDLPVLVNAPEIQMLHFIKQAGSGGENQFCDGFRVVNQLKEEKPNVYQMLCTVPLEYIDHGTDHYDFQLVASRPVINLDKSGHPETVFYSNHLRSWFFDLPAEKIPEMYDSIKTFHDYCVKEENLANFRFKSGEMVIFTNNRILHGRSSFTVAAEESVERHLEGGYVTFDTIKSKIRVIKSKLSPDIAPVSV